MRIVNPCNWFLVLCIGMVHLGIPYAQDSLQTVIAEKGDGIFSLLRKQGFEPAQYYSEFIALNKNGISETNHLFAGRSYVLPPVEHPPEGIGETKYPIFGKTRAGVSVRSNRLSGTVYYLISGHGGPDPGAVEEYNGKIIAEDEYAYDVTLRLARELLSHGAMVYIIVRDEDDGIRDEHALEMDNDEFTYPGQQIPLNQRARLQQRVDAVNKLYLEHRGKYQRLIVTHVDSRSRGENIDVFFYHHEKSRNGKRLAESIHLTFQEKYKKYQPYREYSGTFSDRSNLFMVKNTLPAMAYIEIGNIRSKKDQRRILDPDNRQALAKWIAEGAMRDFED